MCFSRIILKKILSKGVDELASILSKYEVCYDILKGAADCWIRDREFVFL